MPEIDLRTCPNCGVDAIVIEEQDKPNDKVECNNCHAEYVVKDLA